jgi:drug/metabolite transporter (DMT)-like permease
VILTRKLAGHAPPFVTMMMSGLVGLAISSGPAAFDWVQPTAAQWGLMAVVGLFSVAGHLMTVLAFERAPASLLAPVAYVEILSATAVGFVLFSEVPTTTTWIGMAVIIASGLVIGWRERVRARTDTAPPQVKT